jgi:hypothetical protein
VKLKKVISAIFFALWFIECSGQCSILSVSFGEISNCNVGTGLYVIPVTIRYTGAAGTLQVSGTGLYYTLNNKKFSNPNQSIGTNETTFVIYDYADGALNNITIAASLYGGSCSTTANFTQAYSWTAPNGCPTSGTTCSSFLNLSGSITDIKDYTSKDSIKSIQVLETGSNVHYGSNNFHIQLLPGFHAKAGSNLTINLSGCN